MPKKRSAKKRNGKWEAIVNHWKALTAVVSGVVFIGGGGWAIAEYMATYAKVAKVEAADVKLEEKVEEGDSKLTETIQIVQVQLQSAYDYQIEGLYERIAAIKEIRKRRALTADEAAKLDYYEKQLQNSKRMRSLQIERQIQKQVK